MSRRIHHRKRARSRAENALRRRDEVLAIVAHDLRNPLGAIVSGTAALAQDSDEQRRSTYLHAVQHAAQEMDRLIQDLLDVARSEAGALALVREPVDPAGLVRDAIELFRPQAAERGQRLEVETDPGLPLLRADPARLGQALTNLLGNAMKFTPRGGGIRLCARRDGDGVRLSVADDGPGIDPEHVAHVFDRFWQARTDGRTGAGLGLSIARAIVLAHGGAIWVETEPGSGATFHVRLPATA